MSINESCSCGAVLAYTTPSVADMQGIVGRFHEQHKACTAEAAPMRKKAARET